MSREYNFPAFPVPREQLGIGMFLRDYFAAMAMQALVTRYGYVKFEMDEAAKHAYDCADAMLEARKK